MTIRKIRLISLIQHAVRCFYLFAFSFASVIYTYNTLNVYLVVNKQSSICQHKAIQYHDILRSFLLLAICK